LFVLTLSEAKLVRQVQRSRNRSVEVVTRGSDS